MANHGNGLNGPWGTIISRSKLQSLPSGTKKQNPVPGVFPKLPPCLDLLAVPHGILLPIAARMRSMHLHQQSVHLFWPPSQPKAYVRDVKSRLTLTPCSRFALRYAGLFALETKLSETEPIITQTSYIMIYGFLYMYGMLVWISIVWSEQAEQLTAGRTSLKKVEVKEPAENQEVFRQKLMGHIRRSSIDMLKTPEEMAACIRCVRMEGGKESAHQPIAVVFWTLCYARDFMTC
jgi:hypothetical protein